MLQNPALEAEFLPECPWVGVSSLRREPEPVKSGTSDPAELVDRFRASVERSIGDAENVVILFSGGMDSAAVLSHAADLCRRDERGLKAVVWDLEDQFGARTAELTARQLDTLQLDCEVEVIPAHWSTLPDPPWSPLGPRHDYYTRLHQASVELAGDAERAVILDGIGGDEVLGAGHYLSGALVRQRRWRDLRAYLGGFAIDDSIVELAGEVVASAARLLPRGAAFDLYSAWSLRDVLQQTERSVLRNGGGDRQSAAWLAERREIYMRRRQDWPTAALWDAIFPFSYSPHPIGPPVRQASPFIDAQFMRYALGLPLADRFRHIGRHSYHWYKALHFRLLPERLGPVLSTYKQDYIGEFRRYVDEVAGDTAPHCEELGLTLPATRDELSRIHPRLPINRHNVERWIEGALAMGAEPVDDR